MSETMVGVSMKFNDECLTHEDRPDRIVPCPTCGSIQNISWLYWPTRGQMDIMCWEVCGMDFAVNGMHWVLNTWSQEEQQ